MSFRHRTGIAGGLRGRDPAPASPRPLYCLHSGGRDQQEDAGTALRGWGAGALPGAVHGSEVLPGPRVAKALL